MSKKGTYRTVQIRIKSGHDMYNYCDEMCFNSKNLFNTSNYHFRQVFSGIGKSKRHKNEDEVINDINEKIPLINKKLKEGYKKKVKKGKKAQKPVQFNLLSKDNKIVTYNLLDAYFKYIDQVDYRFLPAHTNQNTIKQVIRAWKSYFKLMELYRKGELEDEPKIPKYKKKNGRYVVVLSNQVCVIKDDKDPHRKDKYLRFPKTDYQLNITKCMDYENFKLKEVRIVPGSSFYTLEIVLDLGESEELSHESKRLLGIDIGVNNFATIVNNVGQRPVIVNGKGLKSINQYYNKKRAGLMSILRNGKQKGEGQYHSKQLNRLDEKRNAKVKDFLHKSSRYIIDYAVEHGIDTIVIGYNKGFKQACNMGKKNNQNFTTIPFKRFIDVLEYKASDAGIKLNVTEESYTSKASFLDGDELPVYDENNKKTYKFSGKRIKRGLYRTKTGIIINADVNAAFNIIRKVFPNAKGGWNRGVMEVPIRIRAVC
ncbi:IS200/IS605 family element transposase accessory protein TnpB [Acidaminobacter sp. JC074]|uniref:RNA-guided endonuclease InsQ/TnpB family protein n=1 Tax=Acidaminobacter sp. JC074 TaxID=2530199 RepID=UPI001F0D598E|nr:transposase [Acidaminobacter sp. JC074]MCH4889000.1 IS200/IS605 family element transposase accessory protein TnpB [Acidaminobacter sp. JC074]